MEFFDAHAHYDDEKFKEDRQLVIPAIYNAGITKFVSAGYNLNSSVSGIKLANEYNYIYTTVGISPNDLSENWENDIDKIEELLRNNNKDNDENSKIVAVGEIGLDYHYDTNPNWQKEAFIKQIKIANIFDLPIVIHTREAVMDTLEIIKLNEVKRKGIFHCCPFNRELVKEALKLGFYISVAGPVTFKSSKNAEEIINMIPLDRILIETDSPYLSPEPVRGTRNDSRNIKYIAQKIAEFKNISLEDVAKSTYNNALKVYAIK